MIWNKFFALLLLATPVVCVANSWFASSVVSSQNLGAGIYGDPQAVLGPPTRWVRDTSSNGGPDQRVAPSLGYASWNVGLQGEPLVTTIRTGGQITVRFQPPISDAPGNWYGMDFIVFGNSVMGMNQPFTWNTNLNLVNVAAGPDFLEPMTVSVSPDGIQWYSYPVSATSGADGLWPTQAFLWDPTTQAWGEASDSTKPVPPQLTRFQVTGQTVASAVGMFQGSAGGTAFDLSVTPFRFIRFIRVTGNGGEVDAFARVSRAFQPVSTVSAQ